MKTICVVGSGYVGTTTAALLATAGHHVIAIDVDESKVQAINNSKAPFYEAGLDALISESVGNGLLSATTDTHEIANADVIFSCVGTPDNADGSPNLQYIDEVAETVAKLAKPDAVFVQKSTVPVGTGERLQKIIKQAYVSNPEFLREGSALKDSLLYDRVVIGSDSDEPAHIIASLYEDIDANAKNINTVAELEITDDAFKSREKQIIVTSIKSAELIKVTANAFLALKISFANSVAKLADKAGADITEVMHGVGTDKRIGGAFFNAGRGYGGGCFPKDVSGLISVAIDHGVDFGIMTAANDLNESMPGYIVNKLVQHEPIKDKKIAILGLAFKAGTSDARKSPAVEIANSLVRRGAQVSAYDPKANGEAAELLDEDVSIVKSIDECLSDSDIAIIATDWNEFLALSADDYKTKMSGTIIVDAMNCLDKSKFESAGIRYIGVGR